MKLLRRENISIDSILLTNGRAITFIAASLISAFINLTFIGNLSKDAIKIGFISLPASILMIGISLALECSKLIHITMYNTLSELARKLDSKKFQEARLRIKSVAKRWLVGYILYAVLAVTSGLNFSLMNIGKSATAMDAEVRVYEQIIEQHDEISKLTDEYNAVILDINKTVDTLWSNHNDMIQKYRRDLQDKYNLLSEEEKAALRYDWSNITNAEGEKLYNNWIRYREDYNSAYSANYNNTQLASIKKDQFTIEVSAALTKKADALKADIDLKQSALDKKLEEKKISIAEVQYALEDAKNARILDSGSQAGLRKLAEIFNIKDFSTMVAVFIFVLSFLVELTIYQTSPKVRISRRMLFQFTQYLPKNFDVNVFMKEVDEELISYGIIHHSHIDEAELEQSEIKLARVSNEAKVREIKKAEKSDAELQALINEAKSILEEKSA